MPTTVALIGGEEFADGFEDVHTSLLKLAAVKSGRLSNGKVRVAFLPTCAADDGKQTVEYWCEQARQRLGALGAQVNTPRIIDRESANDPDNITAIQQADWIYLGGGYPHVAMRILTGTRVLNALFSAIQRGVVLSGASGGAMLLCDRSWVITPEFDRAVPAVFESGLKLDEVDLPIPPFLDCLGVVPGTLCWPHFNQFFSMKWLEKGMLPPGITMIGLDEQTAVVSDSNSSWGVLGHGRVTIVDPARQATVYKAGTSLHI